MRFEEGTKDHDPLVASTIMCMPTTVKYSHVVREEKKDGPTFNINRPHQYSFVAPINEGNKANIQLKIYTTQKKKTFVL